MHVYVCECSGGGVCYKGTIHKDTMVVSPKWDLTHVFSRFQFCVDILEV